MTTGPARSSTTRPIGGLLGDEWRGALEGYTPEPFRSLDDPGPSQPR